MTNRPGLRNVPEATNDVTAATPLMTDDEAAVKLEAWLAGHDPVLSKAAVRAVLWRRAELLADRARMAAELEQVRGNAYAEAVEKYAADMADQTQIKSMEIRGGTFHLELDDAREMTAALVATARTMLGDAENYSETRVGFPAGKVEWEVKLAGELDRYVFTVQRAGKLTPHEARMRAEAERDEARAELERLRSEREADAGRVEYATGILSDLTDPDPCWFDVSGRQGRPAVTDTAMSPADVPADLVKAALKPWFAHCSLMVGRKPISGHEEEVRAVLAAVLPLHARRVREGIVAELEAHAAECAALANGRPAHLVEHLANEATYFTAAGRYIASGDGDEDA